MASPRKPPLVTSGLNGKAQDVDSFEEDVIAMEAIAAGKSPAAADDDTTWEHGEAVVRQRSIYESWTEPKRYVLLGLMSFATFLVPFSDTVYLPAMNVIQRDLNTTATLVRLLCGVGVGGTGRGAWCAAADELRGRGAVPIGSVLLLLRSLALFSPHPHCFRTTSAHRWRPPWPCTCLWSG